MKKKIITVMIAGMLALSATACGESGDSSDAPQNDSVQEEEDATPEAQQQTAEEGPAEEPAGIKRNIRENSVCGIIGAAFPK